ncbi:myc box-dependent-interacting protein 1 isoform X2 [Ischnura elegans]|uniref:myc box-dependent-interacting protein 1 isoform X2 n=1 Tax=Ischnura elegans TaxID=197161 RepID=UPI001ED8A752|nr:myc box-dependent-interacting protein 1 isoform X2 [Ischnura elegans]
MAESKGALIAKTVQKHAGRAKEKFLQNLGKVDRTADDIFDEHLQNFTRQQNAANRLQKEFNNYIRCIRACHAASKSLFDSLNEIYESNWSGHELLYVQAQNVEMLWHDFGHKLADQVLVPLNSYQSQFPEMRKKIEKRGRKLVDFDSQRHNFQSLQSNPKKRDDIKVAKSKEMLEEAKRTYEVLNSELHDELPALYDSRVLFLVTNLQTLFSAEQVFHAETSKVYSELEAIVDKLATDCQRGAYTVKKSSPTSPKKSPTSPNSTMNSTPSSPLAGQLYLNIPPAPTSPTKMEMELNNKSETSAPEEDGLGEESRKPIVSGKVEAVESSSINTPNGNAKPSSASNSEPKIAKDTYEVPAGATTDNLPPGVLYRVKATYKYTREDVDELSFEVGEIIRVVEYDDLEEQEEGWLMGIKESNGEKGMFPANFTRPI